MASLRITGDKRLPESVCEQTAKALVIGFAAPSKHEADKGHGCGRGQIEKSLSPDSQFRAAVESLEAFSPMERMLLLRAECVAWDQLHELRTDERTDEAPKARIN